MLYISNKLIFVIFYRFCGTDDCVNLRISVGALARAAYKCRSSAAGCPGCSLLFCQF